MTQCVVITTIMPPSDQILDHCRRGLHTGMDVIVVADRKTPTRPYEALTTEFPNLHLLTIDRQHELYPRLARALPVDHYARKNIGYAYAIGRGHMQIFDTDDDNLYRGSWDLSPLSGAHVRVHYRGSAAGVGFFNVYSLYTRAALWPRGFPLDAVRSPDPACEIADGSDDDAIALWQGLVDGDPDVDAIARLTSETASTDFRFDVTGRRTVLEEGVLCPVNAQNVWWVDRRAFALLYLPGTVHSRVCDILRGYVAQHCLWKRGARIGYTDANAFQARNPHDLLADFEAEVPLYLRARRINLALRAAQRELSGTDDDLLICYRALAAEGYVGSAEFESLIAWMELVQGQAATPLPRG